MFNLVFISFSVKHLCAIITPVSFYHILQDLQEAVKKHDALIRMLAFQAAEKQERIDHLKVLISKLEEVISDLSKDTGDA